MDFHETKLSAAREIALAFGVPPMLLGIPGTRPMQLCRGAPGVLPPDGAAAGDTVSAAVAGGLSEHLGAEIELGPDLDQIPALAEERNQQWPASAVC